MKTETQYNGMPQNEEIFLLTDKKDTYLLIWSSRPVRGGYKKNRCFENYYGYHTPELAV